MPEPDLQAKKKFLARWLSDPDALPDEFKSWLKGQVANPNVPLNPGQLLDFPPHNLVGYPNDVTKFLSGLGTWIAAPNVIFDSILGSAAASIDTGANAIPATHAHLLCVVQQDNNAGGRGVAFQFNGDTGANYDFEEGDAVGAVASAAELTAATFVRIGVSYNVGNSGPISVVFIPNYSKTTFKKWTVAIVAAYDGTHFNARLIGGFWNNTVAINRIKMILEGAGSFDAGTRLSIYGLG